MLQYRAGHSRPSLRHHATSKQTPGIGNHVASDGANGAGQLCRSYLANCLFLAKKYLNKHSRRRVKLPYNFLALRRCCDVAKVVARAQPYMLAYTNWKIRIIGFHYGSWCLLDSTFQGIMNIQYTSPWNVLLKDNLHNLFTVYLLYFAYSGCERAGPPWSRCEKDVLQGPRAENEKDLLWVWGGRVCCAARKLACAFGLMMAKWCGLHTRNCREGKPNT